MKLIGTPTSPYTRKARVVLAEKRIDYEFVIDAPYDAATRVPAYNPLGKVPVLVLDDDDDDLRFARDRRNTSTTRAPSRSSYPKTPGRVSRRGAGRRSPTAAPTPWWRL